MWDSDLYPTFNFGYGLFESYKENPEEQMFTLSLDTLTVEN
jgi:hypothetical protein